MALGLVVFLAGVWFVLGSFLAHGFLMPSPFGAATTSVGEAPPATASTAVSRPDAAPAGAPAAHAKVAWEVVTTGPDARPRLDALRAAAKAEGKPVIIDFWASWCIYCKKLDKLVWTDAAVVAESARWKTIKVDATATDDADMTAIKEEMGVTGLPRVVFIDSQGTILQDRSSGFVPATDMLALMQGVR